MKHAREFPDLSLGVVAFSVAQRDAIEVQLEILRRIDPSCEEFFSAGSLEPFFVKNLENVQGDERDVIFISVGYGKNQDGYMAMSFGPLNKDGGERRLNVLISRAKKAMDVFSNFKAGDIDLESVEGSRRRRAEELPCVRGNRKPRAALLHGQRRGLAFRGGSDPGSSAPMATSSNPRWAPLGSSSTSAS